MSDENTAVSEPEEEAVEEVGTVPVDEEAKPV